MPEGDPVHLLLDQLLESVSDAERDRALLAAVLSAGSCGAALWRGTGAGGWNIVGQSGDPGGLPSAGEVDAVRGGELESQFAYGRAVLVSAEPTGGAALAVGGLLDEERLDRIDALLRVWACFAVADERSAEERPGVRPAAGPVRRDASLEVRALFDAAELVRPAFQRAGLQLRVETHGDLLGAAPVVGERRLFHLVRTLLSEALTAPAETRDMPADHEDSRKETVRLTCSREAARSPEPSATGDANTGWSLVIERIAHPERGAPSERTDAAGVTLMRTWLAAAPS